MQQMTDQITMLVQVKTTLDLHLTTTESTQLGLAFMMVLYKYMITAK